MMTQKLSYVLCSMGFRDIFKVYKSVFYCASCV